VSGGPIAVLLVVEDFNSFDDVIANKHYWRNPVRNIHEEPHSSCVTSLFADRALSFVLPDGATLEDLTRRLAYLNVGRPVAINLRLNS
jgi:hypothetical protein